MDDRVIKYPYLDEVPLKTSVKLIKVLLLVSVNAKFVSVASAVEEHNM